MSQRSSGRASILVIVYFTLNVWTNNNSNTVSVDGNKQTQ